MNLSKRSQPRKGNRKEGTAGDGNLVRLDGVDFSRASEFLFGNSGEVTGLLGLDLVGYTDSVYHLLTVLCDPDLSFAVAPGRKNRDDDIGWLLRRLSQGKSALMEDVTLNDTSLSLIDQIAVRWYWSALGQAVNAAVEETDWYDPLVRHLKREAVQLEKRNVGGWVLTPLINLDHGLVQRLEADLRYEWGSPSVTRRGMDIKQFLERNVTTHFTKGIEHWAHPEYVPCASRELLNELANENNVGPHRSEAALSTFYGTSLNAKEMICSATNREEVLTMALEKRAGEPEAAQPHVICWNVFRLGRSIWTIVKFVNGVVSAEDFPRFIGGPYEKGNLPNSLSGTLVKPLSDFFSIRKPILGLYQAAKWRRLKLRWAEADSADLYSAILRLARTDPAHLPPRRP
jgi:hypothetical protein